MTRAEVNLEGQLHLTQEKVEALEVQAEKIASSKGTSIEVEKRKLDSGNVRKNKAVFVRAKRIARENGGNAGSN